MTILGDAECELHVRACEAYRKHGSIRRLAREFGIPETRAKAWVQALAVEPEFRTCERAYVGPRCPRCSVTMPEVRLCDWCLGDIPAQLARGGKAAKRQERWLEMWRSQIGCKCTQKGSDNEPIIPTCPSLGECGSQRTMVQAPGASQAAGARAGDAGSPVLGADADAARGVRAVVVAEGRQDGLVDEPRPAVDAKVRRT